VDIEFMAVGAFVIQPFPTIYDDIASFVWDENLTHFRRINPVGFKSACRSFEINWHKTLKFNFFNLFIIILVFIKKSCTFAAHF